MKVAFVITAAAQRFFQPILLERAPPQIPQLSSPRSEWGQGQDVLLAQPAYLRSQERAPRYGLKRTLALGAGLLAAVVGAKVALAVSGGKANPVHAGAGYFGSKSADQPGRTQGESNLPAGPRMFAVLDCEQGAEGVYELEAASELIDFVQEVFKDNGAVIAEYTKMRSPDSTAVRNTSVKLTEESERGKWGEKDDFPALHEMLEVMESCGYMLVNSTMWRNAGGRSVLRYLFTKIGSRKSGSQSFLQL